MTSLFLKLSLAVFFLRIVSPLTYFLFLSSVLIVYVIRSLPNGRDVSSSSAPLYSASSHLPSSSSQSFNVDLLLNSYSTTPRESVSIGASLDL